MTVRIIAFRPVYNTIFNNPIKTILFSQLKYLDDHKSLQRWGETWFARTSAGLAEEIGHNSAKSIGNWLREFSDMGIITVRRGFLKGINQLWIQLNHEKIRELLEANGADLSLLEDAKPSPTEQNNILRAEVINPSNSLEAEVTDESNIPQTELSRASNSPQAEVIDESKVLQTELTDQVKSLTGNSISKRSLLKEKDQDQKDQINQSDLDGDFIRDQLSSSQIAEVTHRVEERFKRNRFSDEPIFCKASYLKTALKKEAKKVAATNTKKSSHGEEYMAEIVADQHLTHEELIAKYRSKPNFTWDLPSDAIWDATIEKIKGTLGQSAFDQWIKPARFVEKHNDNYVIGVPDSCIADTLKYRLCDYVKSALCETAGRELEIRYIVRSELRHVS